MYLAIVARILIINQNVFIQVLQEINVPQVLDKILDVWISKMPLVTQPEKRKLLSLALSSLLTVQNELVYERFNGILVNICEALNDIMKDDDDTGLIEYKIDQNMPYLILRLFPQFFLFLQLSGSHR